MLFRLTQHTIEATTILTLRMTMTDKQIQRAAREIDPQVLLYLMEHHPNQMAGIVTP
jgi:hypothetical protein